MNRDNRKLPPGREIVLGCKDIAGTNRATNNVGEHEELVAGRMLLFPRSVGNIPTPDVSLQRACCRDW